MVIPETGIEWSGCLGIGTEGLGYPGHWDTVVGMSRYWDRGVGISWILGHWLGYLGIGTKGL